MLQIQLYLEMKVEYFFEKIFLPILGCDEEDNEE